MFARSIAAHANRALATSWRPNDSVGRDQPYTRSTASPVARARSNSPASSAICSWPSSRPESSTRHRTPGSPSAPGREEDHEQPGKEPLENRPENRMVLAPGDGDGERATEADAGARRLGAGRHEGYATRRGHDEKITRGRGIGKTHH